MLAVVAAVVWTAWHFGYFRLGNRTALAGAVQRAREVAFIGPIFVAIYSGLAGMALPVSPLALAAGPLFGVLRGSLFVYLASLAGASIGYWLGRGVGGRAGDRMLGRSERLARRLRGHRGGIAVLRLQLIPVLPFGLVNAASGMAKVPYLHFLAATAVGVLPGTVAYVWAGQQFFAGVATAEHRALIWALAAAALLVLLSFIPTIIRRLRHGRPDDLVDELVEGSA